MTAMVALVIVIGAVAITQIIASSILEYHRKDDKGQRRYY